MHATFKETFAVTVTPETCVRCINSVIAHSGNEDDNIANDHRQASKVSSMHGRFVR